MCIYIYIYVYVVVAEDALVAEGSHIYIYICIYIYMYVCVHHRVCIAPICRQDDRRRRQLGHVERVHLATWHYSARVRTGPVFDL